MHIIHHKPLSFLFSSSSPFHSIFTLISFIQFLHGLPLLFRSFGFHNQMVPFGVCARAILTIFRILCFALFHSIPFFSDVLVSNISFRDTFTSITHTSVLYIITEYILLKMFNLVLGVEFIFHRLDAKFSSCSFSLSLIA